MASGENFLPKMGEGYRIDARTSYASGHMNATVGGDGRKRCHTGLGWLPLSSA